MGSTLSSDTDAIECRFNDNKENVIMLLEERRDTLIQQNYIKTASREELFKICSKQLDQQISRIDNNIFHYKYRFELMKLKDNKILHEPINHIINVINTLFERKPIELIEIHTKSNDQTCYHCGDMNITLINF